MHRVRYLNISTTFPIAWISLNMTAPTAMTDTIDYFYSQAPVMIGNPPQEVDLTVNTYSTLLASMAYDCNLCAGSTFFDGSLSSTFGVCIHTVLFVSLVIILHSAPIALQSNMGRLFISTCWYLFQGHCGFWK